MKLRFFLICFLAGLGLPLSAEIGSFQLGIEVLAKHHPQMVRGKKVALLVGQPSYDQNREHVIDRISRAADIEVIFTGDPFFRPITTGEMGAQKRDALTNAPIIEITDPMIRPMIADLGKSEVIIVDVQDIGIRYFNYVTLLAQFLELAKEAGIPIMVLDRPNPLSGNCISGPVLNVDFRSQFGVYPIPMVYGMTFGELALFFNKNFGIGAHLTVVGMEGYKRSMTYRGTGLHWFPPSHHIPEPESPGFYAISGLLGELGIFSTGVGTTRPFHYILAPWIDGELLSHNLTKLGLPGVAFFPTQVKTFYGLFQNQKLPGIEIVITDSSKFDPVLTGLAILKVLMDLYPPRIPLGNPGIAKSFDTLVGGSAVRVALMQGNTVFQIRHSWQPKLEEYNKVRQLYLMYPEN